MLTIQRIALTILFRGYYIEGVACGSSRHPRNECQSENRCREQIIGAVVDGIQVVGECGGHHHISLHEWFMNENRQENTQPQERQA